MELRLREGISWCLCNERLVLLDIEADRYLSLPAQYERAFLRWTSSEGQADSPEEAVSLLRMGILHPGPPGAACAAALVDAATRDLLAAGHHAASPWRVLQASLAQMVTRERLRRRRLAELVRAICERPLGVGSRDSAGTAARIAAAFDGAAILVSKTDRCLPRALAAWSMCRSRGVQASLVFGVRVEPFAAHCWVQLGDAVLVGDFEQARLYTPILVET